MDVRAKIVRKVSAKTGNPYAMLEVAFSNGYVFKALLSDEQLFIIEPMYRDGIEPILRNS